MAQILASQNKHVFMLHLKVVFGVVGIVVGVVVRVGLGVVFGIVVGVVVGVYRHHNKSFYGKTWKSCL